MSVSNKSYGEKAKSMARELQGMCVNMMFAILSCGVRLYLFEEVAETH